jgi:hypothetical protein
VPFSGVNHNTSLRGALKICSGSTNNVASSKSRFHVDEMYNSVTKDYTKLVVNMLCDTALLPEGCVPFEMGRKVAN